MDDQMPETNQPTDTNPAITAAAESGKPFEVLSMPVAGIDFREIDIDAHFREHLAMSADDVYKSLIISAQGQYAMAVIPVSARLSIVDVARAIGKKKGTMVSPDVARELTDLEIGAIGPLGLKTPMPIVLDEGALGKDRIAVSGGDPSLHIAIAPGDLIEIVGAITASVTKD